MILPVSSLARGQGLFFTWVTLSEHKWVTSRERRGPWQNGTAERWVGTARRECFDHVIAINEAHVRRLGRELVAYYHEDRTHLGLEKDTPAGRPVELKPEGGRLESQSRIGGLHHRYVWKTAA